MNIDQTGANENMDMAAHVKTYKNFMSFAKFGIAFVVSILALLLIFVV